MNPAPNPLIQAMHPPARIEKLHLDPVVVNPLTGVATCSVCYYEVITEKRWFRTVERRVHRHYTATISKSRPWEYAGTDVMPPYPVYEKLQEHMKQIREQQIRILADHPGFIVQGLYDNLAELDGMARELVYEAMLDGQYGDELRAFVHRSDRVRISGN